MARPKKPLEPAEQAVADKIVKALEGYVAESDPTFKDLKARMLKFSDEYDDERSKSEEKLPAITPKLFADFRHFAALRLAVSERDVIDWGKQLETGKPAPRREVDPEKVKAKLSGLLDQLKSLGIPVGSEGFDLAAFLGTDKK